MHWFLIALCAPFIWSLTNHADKFLLSKYFKGGGAGGLMVFSAVVAAPVLICLYVIDPSVMSIGFMDALILIASGLAYNAASIFYLFALEKEDASAIIPLWQLTPVITYVLGVIILGESLSQDKIAGGIVVILGALILTIEFEGSKYSIKKSAALLMIASSFAIAFQNIFFKFSSVGDNHFFASTFWSLGGFLVAGIICYLVPLWRRQFHDAIRSNGVKVLSMSLIMEVFGILGMVVNNFAILLAPAALVILIEYTAQPAFVFVEGILLTLFLPKVITEKISRGHLTQKLLSIIIMGIGLYFVVR